MNRTLPILLIALRMMCGLLVSAPLFASTSAQPIFLSLPSGTLEIFDPSLEGTPDGSKVWMSYSGSSLSGLGGADAVSIGTRLAYSTDHGAQWHDAGISLYPSTPQA